MCMRSYIVKVNHIGSVVSDILLQRQTNKDPFTFIRIEGEIKDISTLFFHKDDNYKCNKFIYNTNYL